MRSRRKKVKERPFLTGDPVVDYKATRGNYPPLQLTEEEKANNEIYYRMQREDAYKIPGRLWLRAGPQYQDCVNYEKAHPGEYWDQDMLKFAGWVTEWQRKRGIPKRPKDKPSDEFLDALKKVYPGPAKPVPVKFTF